MKYDIYIVHMAGVKPQPVDALSLLNRKGTDDLDIDDDILITALTKDAPRIPSEVTNNTPERTHIKKN